MRTCAPCVCGGIEMMRTKDAPSADAHRDGSARVATEARGDAGERLPARLPACPPAPYEHYAQIYKDLEVGLVWVQYEYSHGRLLTRQLHSHGQQLRATALHVRCALTGLPPRRGRAWRAWQAAGGGQAATCKTSGR